MPQKKPTTRELRHKIHKAKQLAVRAGTEGERQAAQKAVLRLESRLRTLLRAKYYSSSAPKKPTHKQKPSETQKNHTVFYVVPETDDSKNRSDLLGTSTVLTMLFILGVIYAEDVRAWIMLGVIHGAVWGVYQAFRDRRLRYEEITSNAIWQAVMLSAAAKLMSLIVL